MGLMSQMGDMYKLQREARQIKKELSNTHIVAEESGVKVTVTAEQTLISLEIIDQNLPTNVKNLEKAIVTATNKAFKKAQAIAAERMKDVMGGMPGMGA